MSLITNIGLKRHELIARHLFVDDYFEFNTRDQTTQIRPVQPFNQLTEQQIKNFPKLLIVLKITLRNSLFCINK